MKPLLYLLCGLGLLALACSSADGQEGPAPDPGAGTETPSGGPLTLKVMSFNIRYSNTTDQGETNWAARRKPCVDLINDIAPAVAALQESRTDQRAYLRSMLSRYGQLEVPGTGTGSGGNSTLIYRKDLLALLDWGYFYLSDTPDQPSRPWNAGSKAYRTTVWARLQDNATGREFFFFSTHFPESNATEADNEARLKCAQLNVARMQEIAGTAPVFIAGDMNCSYDAGDSRRSALAPFYAWMQSGRDKAPDSDSAYSFNNFGSGSGSARWNLDHIFFRGAVPVQFRVVTADTYGVKYVSDHYPITLTVRIP